MAVCLVEQRADPARVSLWMFVFGQCIQTSYQVYHCSVEDAEDGSGHVLYAHYGAEVVATCAYQFPSRHPGSPFLHLHRQRPTLPPLTLLQHILSDLLPLHLPLTPHLSQQVDLHLPLRPSSLLILPADCPPLLLRSLLLASLHSLLLLGFAFDQGEILRAVPEEVGMVEVAVLILAYLVEAVHVELPHEGAVVAVFEVGRQHPPAELLLT